MIDEVIPAQVRSMPRPSADRCFPIGRQSRALAERWALTRKQLRRGVHTSMRQLEADIRAFIDTHNANPRPFIWTKSADAILAAVKRFCLWVEHHFCHEL